ncbi:radical SAM protein [Methanospirillum sp. J.3.6.1-F.2.7.3]|uniref:Radical SAM protein n=1 Tax=Methanospirillum purgamenti TaxID=2834276 RepID=A0A8E7EK58_9EURY|nr:MULTISPECIES: radical SAM protein [Methanospirillum]MDX8551888.1 radical SAM protein [Methanospirillum hungatei]QVV89160.1 radical SAM protein [Methanospirillum sp. J.3.6.1-F.2.7.3]
MKAKIKPRINLEGRTKLETVIPLSIPFVLFVDPSSVCNFQCIFCPTGDRSLIRETGRSQELMDIFLYHKIINDLQEFDKPLKVLRLYKDGEPLLNPHFVDMVRLAKAKNVAESIDTTTNGSLLTPDLSLRIIDAGLDRINISVDGLSDEQFLTFTRTKVDFKSYVDNIRFFYENKKECEVCVKIPGDNLSEEDKLQFFEIFGDISDRISIEHTAPCWPEFDVEERTGITITQGIYGTNPTDVNVCPYIFYSISVNSDGTVSLCFLDWARKLVIGDVNTQSLKEIWDGIELFRYQIAHLSGRRKMNPVCEKCGQLTHCMPDNIDPYAPELLKKMKELHSLHD